MQSSILYLLQGVLLGGLISIPVGPVNVICLQQTLKKGRIKGFRSTLGATLADSIFALIAILGLGTVIHLIEQFRPVFELSGGFIILGFGLAVLLKHIRISLNQEKPERDWYGIGRFRSFLFTISNPLTVLFFVSYLAGIGSQHLFKDGNGAIFFVLGVSAGSLAWFYSLSGIVFRFRKHVNITRMKRINYVSGGLLCIVGLFLITKHFVA